MYVLASGLHPMVPEAIHGVVGGTCGVEDFTGFPTFRVYTSEPWFIFLINNSSLFNFLYV